MNRLLWTELEHASDLTLSAGPETTWTAKPLITDTDTGVGCLRTHSDRLAANAAADFVPL
jgi:hypothetical protein